MWELFSGVKEGYGVDDDVILAVRGKLDRAKKRGAGATGGRQRIGGTIIA